MMHVKIWTGLAYYHGYSVYYSVAILSLLRRPTYVEMLSVLLLHY